MRFLRLGALLGALLFVTFRCASIAQSLGPDVVGHWDAPREWPVVGIHAVLLPTGKVLHYSYPQAGQGSAAWVWDPVADALTDVSLDRDIFCGGHSLLPDGRVLVTGGTEADPDFTESEGLRDTHIFDPLSETWTRVADMARGRWYPTHVALGDGRALVASGLDEDGNPNPLIEIYSAASGWSILGGADLELDLYPFLHLLPSGAVFWAGPDANTRALDIATGTWTDVGYANAYRYNGTSVLLPPGQDRIMVHGKKGGKKSAEVIDFGDPTPTWQYVAVNSHAGRQHANAIVLPNGKVLLVGGGRRVSMFDPAAGTWAKMAKLTRPRRYHSTALLLPDGRVVAAGTDGEDTIEIYSPPYLFAGPRPVITTAPSAVAYGDPFPVGTDGAAVASVVLIRPAAVTHSVNMEQRSVALEFAAVGSTLTVTAPADPNRAPPGYYMLFTLSADGVPSVAHFVRVDL